IDLAHVAGPVALDQSGEIEQMDRDRGGDPWPGSRRRRADERHQRKRYQRRADRDEHRRGKRIERLLGRCVPAGVTGGREQRGVATFRARPMPTAAFAGRVLAYGIVTGLTAAVVSAPVVAYLFGGVTGSGSALVVAVFLQAGHQLLSASLSSGLMIEPIDKTL